MLVRLSFRIFVKGGGANATVVELKGARTIVMLHIFNSTTSETVSVGFCALGWGEACTVISFLFKSQMLNGECVS